MYDHTLMTPTTFPFKPPKTEIVCLHHADMDGIAAAWAIGKLFPEADCHGVEYGWLPDQFRSPAGRPWGSCMVFLLDFTLPRDDLADLAKRASAVVVIDHHSSAIADLGDLELPNLTKVMSTESASCMLAWRYVCRSAWVDPPMALRHVDDYDRWEFKLPDTRTLVAGMQAYVKTPGAFEALVIGGRMALDQMLLPGRAIRRSMEDRIERILGEGYVTMIIGGHHVMAFNAEPDLTSELLDEVISRHGNHMAFCAAYHDTVNGRVFSLRSPPAGTDVGKLARDAYAGGGHARAAGFTLRHAVDAVTVESAVTD